MTINPSALPRDVRSLRRMIIEKEALLSERAQTIAEKETQLAERDRVIAVRDAELYAKTLQIEHLKAQLAVLRRHRFGRSSEKLDREIEQLELVLGELEEGVAESKSRAARAEKKPPAPAARASEDHKHGRKPMPAHLPRERTVHEPAPTCTACGGTVLRKLGEDVTELLEYIPSTFKVVQIVRPKLSCRACETIAQAPLPSLPIERGRPGPGLLAHVVVSKYADGLPLYRQSEIYARQDIDIDRSTMADWVGCMAALLDPLVAAIGKHVCAGEVLHADDTTVKVLAPGQGRTKTGRLWAVVRDERAFGGAVPPAAFYRYSENRCAEHAHALLGSCRGFLHADGYAGFNDLFVNDPKSGKPRLTEVACWAHARRNIYEVYESTSSPLAKEAVERIAELFEIETRTNGRPPAERIAIRRQDAVPLLADLKTFLEKALAEISGKSALAKAIRYALARWTALTRYTTDGRLEMTNNAVERAIRPLAMTRKNYLFAGSDSGGARAAAMYTLIETAKMNGLDPEAYLRDIIARIADHPINRIAELLPWNWRPTG
ncbi:MAG TPA: IS66 family transposase [Stellaceae bacterium]|jgi:transposase